MTDQKKQQIATLKRRALFAIITAIFLIIGGCYGFYLGWKQVKAPTLLALAFHGVTDKPSLPWETNFSELDEILSSLKLHDFNILTPDQFEIALKNRNFSGRNLLLTFDDGLKTSAQAIKKLYNEQKISSAFFIVTDFIGKENYVDEQTLKELATDFNCKIGLHGKRHYEITKIMAEGDDLLSELDQARTRLAEIVEKPVNWYAYPFGEYNASSVAIIASTSFDFAFTIDGYNIDEDVDFKMIPRVMHLRGAPDAPSPRDWAPPKVARTGSLTITLACLVLFISLSWIFRATNLLKAVKHIEKQEKAE
jgi:peptidoglycan/xylan/chitin deacetylase (PgdA/CDA1 family)